MRRRPPHNRLKKIKKLGKTVCEGNTFANVMFIFVRWTRSGREAGDSRGQASEKRARSGREAGEKRVRTTFTNGVVLNFFPPCRCHGMVWMAIRVSGQRQKHGASLADDVA